MTRHPPLKALLREEMLAKRPFITFSNIDPGSLAMTDNIQITQLREQLDARALRERMLQLANPNNDAQRVVDRARVYEQFVLGAKPAKRKARR